MQEINGERPLMRRLVENLFNEEKFKRNKGAMYSFILSQHGTVAGKKLSPTQLDALSVEILKNFYEQGVEKYNSFSIINTILTCHDFLVHQSCMTDYVGSAVSQTAAELTFQMLSFEREGKKVYVVSPELAEKLKNTELRGLKTEDVFLPYKNIYVCFPPESNFKIYNKDTGWHDLVGVYIDEDREARMSQTRMQMHANPDKSITPDDGIPFDAREKVRHWSLMFVGGKGERSETEDDDALFYFRMKFHKNMTIEQVIKNTTLQYSHMGEDQMNDVWPALFRWALNVIIYVTYTEAGEIFYANKEAQKLIDELKKAPKGSKKRKKIATSIAKTNLKKRLILGGNIIVSRNNNIEDERTHTVSGKQISVRTLVSGHWRRQSYGTQHSLRRMQWIEPFWKGPDLKDNVSVKNHVVR